MLVAFILILVVMIQSCKKDHFSYQEQNRAVLAYEMMKQDTSLSIAVSALEKANLLDEEKVFIIPVRLEKCEMPESLQHLHRVDLFEATGYKKLIRALRRLVESK